jgi:hypothetical protein
MVLILRILSKTAKNILNNTILSRQIFGWISWRKSKISTYERRWSVDCTLKYTKKLNHYTLGSMNKSKTTGHCGFPLTNL